MKFYVFHIDQEDGEPVLSEPFEDRAARLAHARKVYKGQEKPLAAPVCWLDINERRLPSMGAFLNLDLED